MPRAHASATGRAPASLPLSALADGNRGSRQISAAAAQGLGYSLAEFGDLSGLVAVAAGKGWEVVAGHQRLAQLAAAGATEWAVESRPAAARNGRAARDGAGWVAHPQTGARFPVRLVAWPREKAQAARYAANNAAIAGTFVASAALAELEAMAAANLAAMDGLRLDVLREELQAMLPAPPVTEDDVPEPPAVAVSRRGDLWLMGAHRLLCGDSTVGEDVARVMAGERAAVVADPPYGIAYQHGGGGGGKHDRRNTQAIIGDAAAFDPSPWLAYPHVLLWGADHYRALLPSGGTWIAWDKAPNGGPDDNFHDAEFAWTTESVSRNILRVQWKGIAGVKKGEPRTRLHPSQKPTAVMAACIRWMPDGLAILDPYTGSGTTIITAEQLGRRCYAVEIAPQYVDVAVLRWEKLSGRAATLDGDGRTFAEVAVERTAAFGGSLGVTRSRHGATLLPCRASRTARRRRPSFSPAGGRSTRPSAPRS